MPQDNEKNSEMMEKIREEAENVNEGDVKQVSDRAEEIHGKLDDLPGRFAKVRKQAGLLVEMIRDYAKGDYRDVPWTTVSAGTVAALYVLTPFDIIPDWIPGIGYLDDAMVLGLVLLAIREDMKAYCTFKGYDPGEYF